MSTGGGPVFTFSLPGGRLPFAPMLVKPLTLMCVWLSFLTKEALFAALRLTFYVNYKRLLHSDISLCFGFNAGNRALLDLLTEAFRLCGDNLTLTRLTPVATLIDTKQQHPLSLARK